MKYYLAGAMRGYKDFNFPAFHKAAAMLRAEGHEVFSPADNDISKHGEDLFKSADGSEAEIKSKGFSKRRAFYDDTRYICLEAEAIALLPGWENSAGAQAEWALAKALGLEFRYL
jgi:hypothetical protein